MPPIAPESAGIGVRSRRSSGVRRTGTDGIYSSAVVGSVADGKPKWEGKNRFALFLCDHKYAAVRSMSLKNSFAHDLASAFPGFFQYRIQILQLDALHIADGLCFVFDVEEITWHHRAPIFCAERMGSLIVSTTLGSFAYEAMLSSSDLCQ